jgi:predicted transcriptional regulator
MGRKQVIVQLDDELVKSLDRAARKAGINRSELLRQAAGMWLQVFAEEELERIEAEAYGRIPPDAEWDDNIAEWDPRRKQDSLKEDSPGAG